MTKINSSWTIWKYTKMNSLHSQYSCKVVYALHCIFHFRTTEITDFERYNKTFLVFANRKVFTLLKNLQITCFLMFLFLFLFFSFSHIFCAFDVLHLYFIFALHCVCDMCQHELWFAWIPTKMLMCLCFCLCVFSFVFFFFLKNT